MDPAAARAEFARVRADAEALVASVDGEGRPHGLTCDSLTSITLSPPTLLVSVGGGSGTLEAVLSRRAFAVNLLHDGGPRAAELFSSATPGPFTRVAAHRAAAAGRGRVRDGRVRAGPDSCQNSAAPFQ
ncbi:flavin reductase family protein [Nonomuraea sp. NPDC051941]|uniref:flavin reductase family protein n=1 Tax=Nonomuraea sp. NPDC051941 TaxID=3364373 RepID=UPI0037C57FC1